MSQIPRRPRLLVLSLSVVAAVVLLLGLKPLAVSWVDWRLRHDPDYFLEIVDSPADSLRGEALRRFAGSEEGQAKMFEAFLEQAVAFAVGNPHELTTLEPGQLFVFWAGEDGMFHVVGEEGGASRGMNPSEQRAFEVTRQLQSILGETETSGLRVDLFPGLTFSFVRPDFKLNDREIGWACSVSKMGE